MLLLFKESGTLINNMIKSCSEYKERTNHSKYNELMLLVAQNKNQIPLGRYDVTDRCAKSIINIQSI